MSSLPDNINGWHIEKRQLPTVFGLAGQIISDLITELCPDIIINVGQSGGSTSIRVERVAAGFIHVPCVSVMDTSEASAALNIIMQAVLKARDAGRPQE